MPRKLVRLKTRPSRDGTRFTFMLDYVDEKGLRHRISLGHADNRKAELQRAQKERELRMGLVQLQSMKLTDFTADSLTRTGDQIRESTRREYEAAMTDFVRVVGNKDFQTVTIEDAEFYRQKCLDKGNSPATVAKKMREIKCVFETAVKRRQLDENPFAHVKMPRCPKNEIHIYTEAECDRIIKPAQNSVPTASLDTSVRWDLLILTALCTAQRRAELLNCIWKDVDFEEQTITVSPKEETAETWLWRIKDTDRRTLPLTAELTQMLADHQSRLPEGCPYVFVPHSRYSFIQKELRAKGLWTYSDSRLKVVNNFGRDFGLLLKQAAVKTGEFHDLRRTAVCNWFAQGLSEYEIMKLAGHADFKTTHRFYLRVRDDLMDRARQASSRALSRNLARSWRAPLFSPTQQKRPTTVSDCQPSSYSSGQDWS
ncbi:MAG: tyrosine-type recombinase/integrase [Sedimentisphaerales bacterium]|nr:tyrosine-type recombinase/integrase [Sedimentisphaerales bacterium]